MIQKLADLSRHVSFVHHTIRQQAGDFAASVGQRCCAVDVGRGRLVPHKHLFDYEIYVSIDRFESADVVGDAETLPFASGKADTALCTETLEHLTDPQRALAEINRLLNTGGCPILTVPLVWREHNYPDHQRWTEMGLRRMLQSAGFEIQVARRRGGIFSTVGCLMTRIPHQVFGKLENQRSRLLKGVCILCPPMTMPIPWILALLDPLDRLKAFTPGYSVLCRKKSDPL